MENKEIIRLLKRTALLMELHEENAFKIRGFNNAIFNLEKSTLALASLSLKELEGLEGVGKSIAAHIDEINRESRCSILEEFTAKTPAGVISMLDIKGIGPKKIRVIWKTLAIETIEGLLQACDEDKVAGLKGFGKKTQENIVEALQYKADNLGKFHYATALPFAEAFEKELEAAFPDAHVAITGEIRRKSEIVEKVTLLVGYDQLLEVSGFLNQLTYLTGNETISGPFTWRGHFVDPSDLRIEVRMCKKTQFYNNLIKQTGSQLHLSTLLENGESLLKVLSAHEVKSEEEAYQLADLPFIAPELREGLFEFTLAKDDALPKKLVEMEDIRGIIHNHSTYSDGKHTLREMATACRDLGYEYLGISDHSKTAFYANGLKEDRIAAQHEEIAQLNEELAPFRIFKGIESDILTAGELDYAPEILKTFDFIVASIHSGFHKDIAKNTARLLNAIKNPYTTILGHPTGRLLLKREGYPIDHQAIIDACAENNVIIEINANPWRLDLDWRWVHYALSKNVMLSINPDAHDKKEYTNMAFGIAVGRKGGLTREMTLNCLPLASVEQIFKQKRTALLNQ